MTETRVTLIVRNIMTRNEFQDISHSGPNVKNVDLVLSMPFFF